MKRWLLLFLISCAQAEKDLPEVLNLTSDPASMELQKKLVHLSKANQSQESHLGTIEGKLTELRKLQTLKTRDLRARYAGLRDMIAALHRMARHGGSHILERGQGYDDLIRTLILLRALVRTSAASQKTLEGDLQNLHKVVERIKVEHGNLESAQRLLKKQAVQIEELLRQRQSLLKKELARRAAIETRVNKMAEESKNIHDLMRNLSKSPKEQFKKKKKISSPSLAPVRTADKGFFEARPVGGAVVVPFGKTTPDNPDGLGIVFEARPGSRVLCPKGGHVVFAGPFRRYPNIVIVKHTDNYLTLLAGLERTDVDVGQKVDAGEPLGLMAAKGPSKLYLELRHNNRCIRPPLAGGIS